MTVQLKTDIEKIEPLELLPQLDIEVIFDCCYLEENTELSFTLQEAVI